MKRAIVLAFAVIAASPLAMKAFADPATASEQQVAPDRFVVRVQGGADATADQLRERALLRAAQLTAEKGGDWFEIVPRSASPRARAVANTDFGLNYTVTRSCTASGCLTRATPVVADAGDAPIIEQTIEIMIGSGETLEGSKKTYSARDMIAKLSARLS